MILKLVLGCVVGVAAIVTAIAASGSSVTLWTAAMLVLPVLGTLTGALVAGSGRGALADLFKAPGSISARRARAAGETLAYAGRVLAMAGLTGFLVQFVYMMKSLEDRAAFWPNLAWAFGAPLVALVVHTLLVMPRRHSMSEAAATSEGLPCAAAEPEDAVPGTWSPARFAAGSLLTLASLIAFEPRAILSWLFVDAAALIVAIFIPVALVLAALSSGSIRRGFRALRDPGASAEDIGAAVRSFSLMAAALRRAAAIGAATGFVFLIKDWLDRMRYGPTLALALISVFWCAVLLLLFSLPLEAEAKRRGVVRDVPAHYVAPSAM